MSVSIGILVTSRNNYDCLEKFWIPKMAENKNIDKFEILNIDEDSSLEQKNLGKQICERSNITYMDREGRGIHHNLLTACNYFEPKGITFIVWFQTDAWPIQKNFLNSFNALVCSGHLNQFGTVGFNGIDISRLGEEIHRKMIKRAKKGKAPLCVVGRTSLEKGELWLCGTKSRKCRKPVNSSLFKKPFAVSINNWCVSALNIAQFRKHIDVDHKFYFFHGWDDICLQFCKNNVYNLVLPTYYIDHNQDIKRKVKLPSKSVRLAYKGNDTYHSLVGFTAKEWKKVWGYDYDDRKTFNAVEERYKGTHLVDFFHLNPLKGPLKSFDIPGSEYK